MNFGAKTNQYIVTLCRPFQMKRMTRNVAFIFRIFVYLVCSQFGIFLLGYHGRYQPYCIHSLWLFQNWIANSLYLCICVRASRSKRLYKIVLIDQQCVTHTLQTSITIQYHLVCNYGLGNLVHVFDSLLRRIDSFNTVLTHVYSFCMLIYQMYLITICIKKKEKRQCYQDVQGEIPARSIHLIIISERLIYNAEEKLRKRDREIFEAKPLMN